MKQLQIAFLLLLAPLFLYSQDIELVEIASGFSSPVDIAHAGDDRLFIVERSGKIKIIEANGEVLATPFLDIDNIVHNASLQSEQGLLGLAFHPNYESNGFFYVNYTANNDNTVIARYNRDGSNPNVADPNSATIIMTIEQPATNHNGGCLKFGPDGYLYIATGDGGSGNDPWDNAQNPLSLLGKMLRIDVDNGSPYSIPTDNPFADDDFTLDEIWATGLRNPWRFSFDRMTGDIWIGDVGQNAWDEIDFQPAASTGGENYGWRCREGNHVNNNVSQTNCGGASDYVSPVFEIQNMGFTGPCSITGGFVYRGAQSPDLVGKYLCADYCSGQFFMVEPDGGGGWVGQEIADFDYDISTFGEDNDGELYVARLFGGRIYQIKSDACASLSLSVNVTTQPCEGETNGVAEILGAGGTPPYVFSPTIDLQNLAAGDYNINVTDSLGCGSSTMFTVNALPLPTQPSVSINDNDLAAPTGFVAYQWFLNGNPIAGATSENYSITETGNYYVEVTNASGCSNTSNAVNVTFTSLAEIPELEQFTLRPNPFSNQLFFEIEVSEPLQLNIEILDSSGKMVFEKAITVQQTTSQSIDLQALSSGVYYFNLTSEKGSVTRRVVKN